MIDPPKVKEVLKRWDIELDAIETTCPIPGSPERCLHRAVFQDKKGRRYILEQLDGGCFDRKTVIAGRIDQLARSNLAVSPYCRGNDSNWIQNVRGNIWQLSPFVDGIALDRASYWKEAWRGEAIGRFLADLQSASSGWPMNEPPFSLPAFIDNLMTRIRRHDPLLLPEVNPLYEFLLDRLYPVIDRVPLAFCHGDPHPLNTIWGENCINSIIDWEFCGWKPMLYDAALVVGCVGAEDAEAGDAQFVSAFLHTLRQDKVFSGADLDLLPLFVIAVRFGWLSEWLRKKDDEMIAFELFYMRLLMNS